MRPRNSQSCGPKQSLALEVELEICRRKGAHLETNNHREVRNRGWGWCSRGVREAYDVGVWKAIKNE